MGGCDLAPGAPWPSDPVLTSPAPGGTAAANLPPRQSGFPGISGPVLWGSPWPVGWWRAVDAAGVQVAATRVGSRTGGALRLVARASDGAGLWLATAAALAAAGGSGGRRAAARGVAALGATSALVNGPLKLAVRRRRPGRLATAGVRRAGRVPRTSSFPSGHTASAFSFATAATLEMPAAGPVLGATAMLVAWSRVHGGRHFPSDVAAGAVLGTAVGVVAGRAFPARLPSSTPAVPQGLRVNYPLGRGDFVRRGRQTGVASSLT